MLTVSNGVLGVSVETPSPHIHPRRGSGGVGEEEGVGLWEGRKRCRRTSGHLVME